jgi:hypothetical protein
MTKNRVVAAFIGLTALVSVLASVSYLIGYDAPISPAVLVLLFPTASLVGVVSAVGLWTPRRWGWWLAACYLVFQLLAVAPSIIVLQALPFGAVDYFRFFVELAVLAYLFAASTRLSYGVSGSLLTVAPRVVIPALLCAGVHFGSLVYFAVQAM